MRYSSKNLLALEANIDNMNPELYPPLMESLFKAGALDVSFHPIVMKKGRPGILLNVLCPPKKKEELLTIIFTESTTLGIRTYPVERFELKREIKKVKTKHGEVLIKIGKDNRGNVLNIAPEFESLKKLSREKKIPLKSLSCYRKD